MGQIKVTYIKPEYKKLPKEVFGEIAESLEGIKGQIVSLLKEGSIPQGYEDKYRRVSEDLSIVSAYFRHREKTTQRTTPLYKHEGEVLIPFVDRLRELPEDILSEVRGDIGLADPEGYTIGVDYLTELSNTIAKYILQRIEETDTLFPEETTSETKVVEQETKEDYLLFSRSFIVSFIVLLSALNREIKEIPVLREEKEVSRSIEKVIIPSLKESLTTLTGDLPLGVLKQKYEWLRIIGEQILEVLSDKDKDYRIETLPDRGKVTLQFKSQSPETHPETALEALQDLAQIQKSSKSGQIRVPKDLLETEILSKGDTLELIKSEKMKSHIRTLQKKGKLLNGTMEGLSGGKAYFKIFTIALAQTLNEQSKFYQTESTGSGVPLELAKKYIGEGVKIEEGDNWEIKDLKDSALLRDEKRFYPYVLISYEDLAKKMKGADKISGGKDSEYIRNYIESLQSKEYLLADGRGGIVGVRYIVKLASLYLEKSGNEVGCILQLSPQFSKTLRGYSGLRADTIKLLGGGQQKDITMNLLDILIYTRGISGGVYRKSKEDLLSQIGTNKRYERSKKEREKDFQEAVQKAKDSKIISKYQEERNSGGEIVSVFVFTNNPDYLKGEDLPERDVQ